jgi:hypothetical protein
MAPEHHRLGRYKTLKVEEAVEFHGRQQVSIIKSQKRVHSRKPVLRAVCARHERRLLLSPIINITLSAVIIRHITSAQL